MRSSRRELAGSQGSRLGGSAPTTSCSAMALSVPPGTMWLCQSSLVPLDLLRDGACFSLAPFDLNFGEQISHQLRRIRVWWACAACGGYFLATSGVGQLPLITDRDIATVNHQEFMFLALSLLSVTDGLQRKKTYSLQGRRWQSTLPASYCFCGNITLVKIGKVLRHHILMTLRCCY